MYLGKSSSKHQTIIEKEGIFLTLAIAFISSGSTFLTTGHLLEGIISFGMGIMLLIGRGYLKFNRWE